MRSVVVVLAWLLALATAAPVVAAPGIGGPDAAGVISALRRATVAYHDPAAAIADGYVATEECVSVPGLGTMGYHYGNFGLFDATLEVTRPEGLLYVPSPSGPRLVAAEWVVVDVGQPHPSLLGVPFDGPMPGHVPGMPAHYELHAWIWQANPEGVFAPFNPSLSC